MWVKGRRVYANRAVWRMTHGPIPDGYQVDHIDDNSMNDAPSNLQLLDGDGNRDKEANREGTKVCRFKPSTSQLDYPAPGYFEKVGGGEFPYHTTGYVLILDEATNYPPGTKLDWPTQDWRVTAWDDLKAWSKGRYQAARRLFDKYVLGFRY